MTFTDYVFEKSYNLEKAAVINKEQISYKEIYENINYVTNILRKKITQKRIVYL
ncbi:hypothetical protein CcarbDRAFT_3201 [Clostridium carboxidivorans P7]|uniref:Uncharacterized protein n=1 Tax=Clostridium carboxidivorans P7 TaxID=536227 RepID=C6PWN4_9CLOT|nr:hypothetical protein [Clostridium carboxidivorans]EET86322.1 hypothetical protein CcarbDRAFT_3201 [Clostridium carboxidivorans P7]